MHNKAGICETATETVTGQTLVSHNVQTLANLHSLMGYRIKSDWLTVGIGFSELNTVYLFMLQKKCTIPLKIQLRLKCIFDLATGDAHVHERRENTYCLNCCLREVTLPRSNTYIACFLIFPLWLINALCLYHSLQMTEFLTLIHFYPLPHPHPHPNSNAKADYHSGAPNRQFVLLKHWTKYIKPRLLQEHPQK